MCGYAVPHSVVGQHLINYNSLLNSRSHIFTYLFIMQQAFQPQIILLREGTDTSQGKSQIVSNINACMAVAETVRTTLGPRGMDKLVFVQGRTTISNDGATIMKLLDIVHPAAKTLVDISMAQVCYYVFIYLFDLIKALLGCGSGRRYNICRSSRGRDFKGS